MFIETEHMPLITHNVKSKLSIPTIRSSISPSFARSQTESSTTLKIHASGRSGRLHHSHSLHTLHQLFVHPNLPIRYLLVTHRMCCHLPHRIRLVLMKGDALTENLASARDAFDSPLFR